MRSSSRLAQAPCRCGTPLSCQYLSNLPGNAACYGDGQIYKSHGYGHDETHLDQPKREEFLSPFHLFMNVCCSCSHGKPFPVTFPVILPIVCFSERVAAGAGRIWGKSRQAAMARAAWSPDTIPAWGTAVIAPEGTAAMAASTAGNRGPNCSDRSTPRAPARTGPPTACQHHPEQAPLPLPQHPWGAGNWN